MIFRKRLEDNSRNEELILRGQPLAGDECTELAKILAKNNTWKSLYLKHCHIGTLDVEKLADALEKKHDLAASEFEFQRNW